MGELHLKIDQPGWKVSPAAINWTFNKTGETMTAECTISPPDNAAKANLVPEIKINQSTYHHKITTIDYEHLPYMSIVGDATIRLQSMDMMWFRPLQLCMSEKERYLLPWAGIFFLHHPTRYLPHGL
jgi:hypothetical protein